MHFEQKHLPIRLMTNVTSILPSTTFINRKKKPKSILKRLKQQPEKNYLDILIINLGKIFFKFHPFRRFTLRRQCFFSLYKSCLICYQCLMKTK